MKIKLPADSTYPGHQAAMRKNGLHSCEERLALPKRLVFSHGYRYVYGAICARRCRSVMSPMKAPVARCGRAAETGANVADMALRCNVITSVDRLTISAAAAPSIC